MSNFAKRFGLTVAGLLGVALLAGSVFYLACMNHTSINEIGVAYDANTGRVWIQTQPGFYRTSPLVRVTYISTLPIQVTVPSNAKVIVSKMVRFRPEGIDEFIRLQGYSYLSSSNLPNVMLGWAYTGGTYSFLEVLQDPGHESGVIRPLTGK
jgi:hypothetical protein